MDVWRQGQQHDNAMNVVSFIEPFDRFDDATGGCRHWEQHVNVIDAASAHCLRDCVAISG